MWNSLGRVERKNRSRAEEGGKKEGLVLQIQDRKKKSRGRIGICQGSPERCYRDLEVRTSFIGRYTGRLSRKCSLSWRGTEGHALFPVANKGLIQFLHLLFSLPSASLSRAFIQHD